jgi:hypothetical protein
MKKAVIKAVRVSLKQRFADYRQFASNYIYSLQHPTRQLAFSVKGYEVTPTGKKPNVLSAPEVLAIVGTAATLGKDVLVTTSGIEDGGQINFYFMDKQLPLPNELRGY